MHYSTILALLSAPLLAFAQDPNAFAIPDAGLSATGGEPLELNWNPTTDGTVTLVLRSGSSNDLNEGTIIAENIDNSGSFTWTPENSLTRGSDYTVEIVDDDDPSNVNYTPYFVLDTPTTTPQQTSVVSLGQPTTTPDLSSASATGDATTLTEELATSTGSSAETTETETATSTATETTATGSMSSGMMTSASNTASQSAADTAASASDASAPEQTDNAASKKTAMVGMLGAVALGAFAL